MTKAKTATASRHKFNRCSPLIALAFLAVFFTAFRVAETQRRHKLPAANETIHVPQEEIDFIKYSVLPYAQSAFCAFEELESWSCIPCIRGSEGTVNITTFGGTAFTASGYTAFNPSTQTIIIAMLRVCCLQNGYETVNLLFTGHSLGGALATIAAADVYQHLSQDIKPSQVSLLTFGQPRVGNSIFSTWINSFNFTNSLRITNQDDWTPHLPPDFSGFKHFHKELWIANKEGDTIECWDDNGDEEWISLIDSFGILGGDRRGDKRDDGPSCADRLKWKYDARKHAWVWDQPIGFHVCLPLPQ
ncbi:Alpha/Beta hydrolase protein [Obelidium mucronatum]|nr:Alpha/Beta hydrolase protein [Obelidium mucronatum]